MEATPIKIEVLNPQILEDGAVIIMTVDGDLSAEDVPSLQKQAREMFGKAGITNEVLIVTKSVEISVLKKDKTDIRVSDS